MLREEQELAYQESLQVRHVAAPCSHTALPRNQLTVVRPDALAVVLCIASRSMTALGRSIRPAADPTSITSEVQHSAVSW